MTLKAGEDVRREVMGDAFVDRALDTADELTQPLQEYINDHCWGADMEPTRIGIENS